MRHAGGYGAGNLKESIRAFNTLDSQQMLFGLFKMKFQKARWNIF